VTESQVSIELATVYRAFGFIDGGHSPARPVHIAPELEFVAWLVWERRRSPCMALADPAEADRGALCGLAQLNFFRDHLAAWASSSAAGLRRFTGGGYFEPLGRVLAAWIPMERHYLGIRSPFESRRHRRSEVPVGT
jgi:hypothetical protein